MMNIQSKSLLVLLVLGLCGTLHASQADGEDSDSGSFGPTESIGTIAQVVCPYAERLGLSEDAVLNLFSTEDGSEGADDKEVRFLRMACDYLLIEQAKMLNAPLTQEGAQIEQECLGLVNTFSPEECGQILDIVGEGKQKLLELYQARAQEENG